MDTFIIGYLLFISTQIIRETVFRKGKEAKEINIKGYDKGTSILNGIYIFTLLIFPLILFILRKGFVNEFRNFGNFGVIVMLTGMAIHFIAIDTLGTFFTRTLRVVKDHILCKRGIYKNIRHPGYLGTILIGIGFGIASYNWILLILITLLMIPTYLYRIKSEEEMLLKEFGKEYESYRGESWALIPFII